jgi:hypothetical protein
MPAPGTLAAAQPSGDVLDAPNPLDLVRGLREQGMSDLALDYLHDLAAKPGVPAAIKDQIPLERAKCQLEAAIDEPDEGTRISLIGEAKEGFLAFVRNGKNAGHPRMPEAFLSLARLTSMDAKAQLAKARRIDIPQANDTSSNNGEIDEAKKRQKEEAAKARPLFDAASKQFKSAAAQLQAQLDKKPDPAHRKALLQTLYDAELARGTNQLALADTYIESSAKELADRDKKVEEAQAIFSELIHMEGAPARVVGLARAWNSECEYAKKDLAKAEEDVKRIEASTGPDSEEAKRMVRFFKIRRDFESAIGAPSERSGVEARCHDWLRLYGLKRNAQSEAFAIRWYLGYLLQLQANALLPKPPANPPKTPQPPAPLPALARARYQEAEKLYRVISQSDNDYSERAARQRMYVVRRLMGDAEQMRDFERTLGDLKSMKEEVRSLARSKLSQEIVKLRSSFKLFEECQMASLIQMSRALDLQKGTEKNQEELAARQKAVIALLERARELATPKDNPADVADIYLRLIYYYEITNQPYQAAILGEHMARTTKAPGGKSALAGALALFGYSASSAQIKNVEAEKLDGLRKLDRDRAIRLARYLDKQFPNDTATDRARHRLAALLYEDQKPVDAYDALLKVRAGYELIAQARLFQGAIVYQLLSARDSPLAQNRRRDVFRRTVSDLDRLVKPLASAAEDEIRPYISGRCRLALLYLLQPRVDPEAEKLDPGYVKARKVAEETLALVPAYHNLIEDVASKSLNSDGWELRLLAEDAKVKAALLEGQSLFLKGKYDEAYKAIGDLLADMNRAGPFTEQIKAVLADGPKPEPKKETEPAPKKGPDKKQPAKKDAALKKEPEPKKVSPPKKELSEDADKDQNDPQKDQIKKLAEGVDRYRRDLIVLALKIRVKKGEAEKGVEQLDLLKKLGGSIEANIATLEQITAEMASQIVTLKREGKPAEAKALSDGFSKLLDKLSAEQGLPVSVQRFLGQSLILVGQFDRAIETLKKVPPPANHADLFKPNEIADAAAKRTVLEYRRAALELLRAYRQANKYAEADAIIADAMGTPEKPGWAANSLDFRVERANLFEARGAAASGPDARKAWGEALKEWGTLANIYRAQVSNGPQPGAGGGNRYLASQNSFYEMYFFQRRCLLRANLQLLPKGDAKMQKHYDDAGKAFAELEMVSGHSFNPEVRDHYHDLVEEMPELKKAYEKAIQDLLPKAKARSAERQKDADAMQARAAKLPQESPDRAKLEDRAKLLSADAAWMKSWTGGFFLNKPALSGGM